MTKQNLVISVIYWAIYAVFAFFIWRQHDESSDETVKYMTFLWAGVYVVAVVIVLIRKWK